MEQKVRKHMNQKVNSDHLKKSVKNMYLSKISNNIRFPELNIDSDRINPLSHSAINKFSMCRKEQGTSRNKQQTESIQDILQ
jgi:ribosomal protein S3AE